MTSSTPSPAVPRKRRTWLKRLLIVGFLGALLARIVIPILLPGFLTRIAEEQGLALVYEKLDVSLLTGNVELWHVDLQRIGEENTPLTHLEYLLLDWDITALLTGDLQVHRVEIDGLDVYATRTSIEQGWSFEGLLPASAVAVQEPPTEENEELGEQDKFEGFDLGLPMQLSALRLQHVQLHVKDLARVPAFEMSAELNVRLSDLGSPQRPARLEVFAHSQRALDAFHITGSFESGGSELAAELSCQMKGLRLGEFAPYLEPLGLNAKAERTSMGMNLSVLVQAAQGDNQELQATVEMSNITLEADAAEAVAVDLIKLQVDRLAPQTMFIESLQLQGIRANARRLESGYLMIAGVELVPIKPADPVAVTVSDELSPPAEEINSPGTQEPQPRVSISAVQVQEVQLLFEDDLIQPATQLEWIVEEFALRDIQIDATRPNHPVVLEAQMHGPGLLGSLSLQGQLRPFGDAKACELRIQGQELKTERLLPYLNQAGVHCALDSGSFSAQLNATTHTDSKGVSHLDLSIEGIELADHGRLFGVEQIALKGLQLDPSDNSIRIDELGWTGTEIALQIDDEQRLHALGWGLGLPLPPSDPQESGSALQLALQINDLGFTLRDLHFGGNEADQAHAPAALKFWCSAPGLAQKMELEGTLQSQPGPLDLALELSATGAGIRPDALQPILTGMGLESQLDAGELQLALTTQLQQTTEGLRASVEMRKFEFSDQGQLLVGLEKVDLPTLLLNDDGVQIPSLTVAAPYMRIGRDAEGALLLLGMRMPAGNSHGKTPGNASVPGVGSTQPAPADIPHDESASNPPMGFSLEHFALQGARVDWTDQFMNEPIATALQLDAQVDDLTLGTRPTPTLCEVRVKLDGSLEELRINAQTRLDPNDFDLDAKLNVSGLRAGPLAGYLPSGLEFPLENGQLNVQLLASALRLADDNGYHANVQVKGLDYRDAGASEPLLAFDSITLNAPRIDAHGQVYEVEELSIAGLELASRRTSATRFEVLGLALESAVANADQEQASTEQAIATEPAPVAAPGAGPVALGSRGSIPTVLLDKLDLGIAHLRFVDESGDQATPLDAQFRLSTPGPVTLLAANPEDLPPIELLITGSASPLLGELDTRISLTPFKLEPSVHMSLIMRGIRGEGLTELLPELNEILDGSELPDGQFEATLDANLLVRRKSPLDFDLSSGFGADLELAQVALRATPEGPALVGLESLNIALKSMNPSSGDVHLERIELVRPLLHATKAPEGLRVAGLLLKTPAPEVVDEESTDISEPDSPATTADVAPPSPPVAGSSEVRLDELLISGADFSFVDSSVEPAMHLPIAEFDLEVKRFSTRTFEEELPFRFDLSIYGGDISLPKREVSSTLVGGLLSSVGSLITMEEGGETEERPVFDEVVVRGNLSLGPQPKGWTLLRVRALELPGFRGSALSSGIEIGDGLLDETAMVRFDGKGGMHLASDTRMSYLSLAEPADGPISAYLKLPMPIDSVLFVLRNDEGDQVIPLEVSIQDGAASLGNIMGALGTTLATVIGESLASSPMRIVGGVLDLVGLGDEQFELEDSEPVLLAFPAGEVLPEESLQETLAPLLDLLRQDESLYLVLEHQLSSEDLARCDLLANPAPGDCLELAAYLRKDRTELLNSRERLATEARAAYAIGRHSEAEQHARGLRAIDQQIGRTEAALDRVYEQSHPGAERGRARRARGTAIEIARRRLDTLTEFIKSQPIVSIGSRCETRRPRFGITDDIEHSLILIQLRQRR